MAGRLKWDALVMAAPAVLLIVGFFLLPLLRIFALSVTEPTPGFGNYAHLVNDAGLRNIMLITLRICILTSVVAGLLGYIVAYTLVHSSERLRDVMFFFILVPLWLSGLVRAFAWIMILRRDGLINVAVQWLGLSQGPLPIGYNEFAVVVAMVHYMLPYAILPLYANMRDIDRQLIRAARGLGATRGYAFRRIFFPLSVPGLFSALTLVFIMSLGFYVLPLLISGGRVSMIAEYIAVNVLDTSNWGLGSMLAVTLLVLVFALYAISRRVAKTEPVV
jgi:putative spermidine/putrescine transport system permease protein